jgi:hypothetical protein
MIITVTKSFEFQLQEFIFPGPVSTQHNVTNVVALATCLVFPGTSTVPDWVAFNETFLTAVADGDAAIVEEPTGNVTLAAGATSANVALPTVAGAQSVVVTNPDTTFDLFVLLGDSSVEVTPSTGIDIFAGSSIMIPLDGNTFLAALGAGTCQISVI